MLWVFIYESIIVYTKYHTIKQPFNLFKTGIGVHEDKPDSEELNNSKPVTDDNEEGQNDDENEDEDTSVENKNDGFKSSENEDDQKKSEETADKDDDNKSSQEVKEEITDSKSKEKANDMILTTPAIDYKSNEVDENIERQASFAN